MWEKTNEILSVLADMEACVPAGDELSDLVASCDSGELAEDDLDLVAAAGAGASYDSFLRRFGLK